MQGVRRGRLSPVQLCCIARLVRHKISISTNEACRIVPALLLQGGGGAMVSRASGKGLIAVPISSDQRGGARATSAGHLQPRRQLPDVDLMDRVWGRVLVLEIVTRALHNFVTGHGGLGGSPMAPITAGPRGRTVNRQGSLKVLVVLTVLGYALRGWC